MVPPLFHQLSHPDLNRGESVSRNLEALRLWGGECSPPLACWPTGLSPDIGGPVGGPLTLLKKYILISSQAHDGVVPFQGQSHRDYVN